MKNTECRTVNVSNDIALQREKRETYRFFLFSLCSALFLFSAVSGSGKGSDAEPNTYSVTPSFVENRGQWNSSARYALWLGDMRAWFVDGGIWYDLAGSDGTRHVLRWSLVGACATLPEASRQDDAYRSWMIGRNQYADVPGFRDVLYRNLLPGVDARFNVHDGNLKYDLILAPGADPHSLLIQYEGASGIEIDPSGALLIRTTAGVLSEEKPIAYQNIEGTIVPVDADFILRGQNIAIELGDYDSSYPLVIDPLVRFSTYLGGNGFEEGRSVRVDSAGNVYVTGQTRSVDFPTVPGAYRRTLDSISGSRDIFVAKLDPTGQRLIWGTYVGGTAGDDPIAGLRLTKDGHVLVGGITLSPDFPTTLGAVNFTRRGNVDGFLLSFAQQQAGTRVALEWATYLGGTSVDSITAFDLNSSGNIVLTGLTRSIDFVMPGGGLLPTHNGGSDAFVLVVSGDGKRAVSGTFLGGTSDDRGVDIAVGKRNEVTVTGWTNSGNFPRTPNAISSTLAGGGDIFVAQLSPDNTILDYGTFLGGSGEDFVRSLALDTNGLIYLTGNTESGDFPDNVGAASGGAWFVSKIDPAAGQLLYSRYLTSNITDRGVAITADKLGRATMCGVTSSATFPITGGGVESPGRGKNDLAFVRLSADGKTIEQSSVVGGSEDDIPASKSWLSPFGDLYVTGGTHSPNLPLGRFPFDKTLNTIPGEVESDAFVLAWSFDPRPNLIGPTIRILDTLDCDSTIRDTFYIYNDGDVPVKISGSVFENEDVRFILETPDRFPNATIAPGDSLRYIVRFVTTGIGGAENKVLIFHSDTLLGKNPLAVPIRAARFAPSVTFLPQQLRFGSVLICRDSTITLSLFNDGIDAVTVLPLEFTSGGMGLFVGGAVFPLTIPGRGSKEITVRFKPEDAISYNDTLILRVRECDQSIRRVPIIAQGDQARLSGAPDTIRFAPLEFCASGHDTTITLRNVGTVQAVIRSRSLSGTGFSIQFPEALPDTVAPREEVKVTIRFAPPSEGDFNAEATIVVGPCDSTLHIVLIGSRPDAVLPVLSIDTLDFGTVSRCKNEFKSQDVTLLSINNPSDSTIVLGTPIITSPFTTCSSIPFPSEIAPNRSTLPFCLRYAPLLGNHRDSGWILIPYSIGGCSDTLRVRLVGAAETPTLVPDITNIDLLPFNACESFRDTIFTLQNGSESAIVIDSAHLDRGIEILDPPLPRTIPPGESVVVRVRFAPTTSGTSVEQVRLYLSYLAGCVDSLDLTVSGSAEGIIATTDRDSILFTPLLVCNPAGELHDTLYLSWTGTSSEIVRIAKIGNRAGESEFVVIDPANLIGKEILQGERFPIPLAFSSGIEGIYRDTLELIVEPCMDTILIPLTGEVVEPIITITGGNFGDVEVLATGNRNIVVSNESSILLTLDTIYVAGIPFAAGPAFPTLPMPIGEGDVVVFPMKFTPTTTGDVLDSIVLKFSGQCDRTQVVYLSGRGVRSDAVDEFCIGGIYSSPGRVGDTVEIPVRVNQPVQPNNPVDLDFYFRFDPVRFDFAEGINGTVQVLDETAGTVVLRAGAVASIPDDLPTIRLRLLAGAEPFAVVHLDSVVLVAGTGFVPNNCDSTAIVSIANRCFISGLSIGKYPNRLERPVPNPANGTVEITFQQLEDAETLLRVWNTEGREVLRPLQGMLPGGRYTVRFLVDELPAGVYFYGVQAGSWNEVGRLMIQR